MADHRAMLEALEDSDVSSHLLSKLKHAQLTSRTALEAEFARLGLTISQFLALAFIDENNDISSAELARKSHVSPQAMMTIVARMEAAKLIRRTPASCGGRALNLALTPDGEKMLDAGRMHAGAIEYYLLALLGDTTYRQLLDALDKITNALGQGATMTRRAPWHEFLPPDEQPA